MMINSRITVIKLGSGWAAAHVADYEGVTDVVETGVGRYRTEEEAKDEAMDWAEAEGLPYK